MLTIELRIFAVVSVALAQLSSVFGQQLPPIACPQYFSYEHDGLGYFGKIVLPQWPVGTAELRVHTSERGLPSSSYHGRVAPYPNEPEVIRDVLQHKGATFRVDFPDPSSPPKLTLLSQAGVTLCTGTDYLPPNSWHQLSYTLSTYYVDAKGNKLTSVDGTFNLNDIVINGPSTTDQQTTSTSVDRLEPTSPQSSTYTPVELYKPISPQPSTYTPVELYKPISPQTNTYTPVELYKPISPQSNTRPQTPVSPGTAPTATNNNNLNAICGMEGGVVQSLVYGGTDIERGEFPWLTAIYKKAKPLLQFKCGGTLLSRSTVISAAHCFKNVEYHQIVLFLGRYNLVSFSEQHFISASATKLITHPNYKHNTADADLALILMEPLEQFTQYIRPICMWSEPTDNSVIRGKQATVVGWGSFDNREDTNELSAMPKKVEVSIATNEDCTTASPTFAQLVSGNTICAGNRDGSGPCTGDSGGGLMMLRNDRWVLRGIVSLGQALRNKCNLLEYVVYCDVAKYTQWIRDNMLL